MHILLIFLLLPLTAGIVLEYVLCRVPKKRFWRRIPPIVLTLSTITVVAIRHHLWNGEDGAPIETLLFFPGLPVLALAIGLFIGFRLWKWLWTPQIYRGKKKMGPGGGRD